MQVQVQTRDGGYATVGALEETVAGALPARFGGAVLTPGANGYEEARRVWNGMIDRRPALIAQCASAQDVAVAVRFARAHNLLISVRGGGHNIAGNAVCDDGMMIDLSPMRHVAVDPVSRTAWVQAGATLGDVDGATQVHGLATPLGINSTTGIAGLTLGGGFGWLSRSLGLTVDNLLSVDVVTADGEEVRASENENLDLFWALRGGGGNFGIATSFEFRLHPVGPEVFSGLVVHPLAAAKDVLRSYRDFMKSAPDEFTCWFVLRKAPPLPFLPEEWHGKEILALAVCHNGPIQDGERIAAPLRAIGSPIADVLGPHLFTAWEAILDPLLTPGMRNYWKSNDFRTLDDGLIDVLVDYASRIPDPQTEIACAGLGGAVSSVPADATPYNHRDGQFVLNVHGRWAEPAKDEECIGWARALWAATVPYSTGAVYVNFLTQDEQDRVRAAYGPNYDRLAGIKAKYDPTNLFRMNQNIQPTA